MIKKLSDFVSRERNRFETKHNNMFAFSFSEIHRYYEFLKIIFDRYKKVSKEYIDNTRTLQKTFLPGSHPMTDYQMKLQSIDTALSIKVQFEIESFYLFAKIFLDKTARALEFYFGQLNKKPLDSHDDLTKSLQSYAKEKNLVLTSEFLGHIGQLKQDISDFLDKFI